jgi:membrane protein
MSAARWIELARRAWREAGNDNIGIVAAGVAFYCFLALVPLLAAIVLTYGLLADPETIVYDAQRLASVMPPDVGPLLGEQLIELVRTSDGKKGLGLLGALAMALFGTRNGAGSVITALNVAFEVRESRGLLALNARALVITACAVVAAIVASVAIAALGHLRPMIPGADGVPLILGKVAAYALLGLVGTVTASLLYRYGPDRRGARWTWITPGSLFATGCWLLLTLGFGAYVARIGDYNATYGSLSAVVVLLTWLFLSSYALLFGAELDCEATRVTNPPAAPAARG